VNWNVLGVSTLNPEGHVGQLAASDAIAARGGRLVALTLPHSMRVRLSFLSGTILDGLPGWREVMALPVDARVQALVAPETRLRLREGAASDEAGVLRAVADWPRLTVLETFAPEHESFEGRTIRDIARELGRDDHFDVLLDIVVADRLRTGLGLGDGKERAPEWELRAEVWRDPRTVIGGSDAGAHLDMMCGAIYSTALLAHGVREFQVITLEDAVRHLTDVPARLYGLTGRGRIADGYAADITIFDPERVGYEPERMRDDLPGGASRLYAESVGVHHVLVNGQSIVTDGAFTDATPGTLLRAGRDTHDVAP
jgi:N-acyl-D-aspartate/D-glutamate deacylase